MADQPSRSPWRDRDGAWALGLGLVAALWSGIGVWSPSVWADEGATLSATQRSWGELWLLLGRIDAVHGLYYALLKVWFGLAGVTPVTLRLPGLLAVAGVVALAYLLARTWLDRPFAVLAAGLVAALPRTTWMAIEGRSWAQVTLLGVASTLVLVRALSDGAAPGQAVPDSALSPREVPVRPVRPAGRPTSPTPCLFGYAALLAIGCNLSIYLVFLAAAHGLTVLLLRPGRRLLLGWLAAAAVAGAAVVPVALAAYQQRGQLGPRTPLTVGDWLRDVVAKQFTIGATPGDAPVWVPRQLWSGAAIALAVACWLLLGYLLLRAFRDRTPGLPDLLSWNLPWLLLPPTLALLASLATGGNLYHPRYFGFTVPAFAILVAAAVRALPWRRLPVAVAVGLLLLTVPVQLSQRDTFAKDGYDWSQVAARIASGAHPGDAVYFGDSPPTRQIAIAYPDAFTGLADLALLRSPAADGSLSGASQPLTPALLASAPTRVWAALSVRDDALPSVEDAFAAAGYQVADRWTGPQTTLLLLQR